MLVGKLNIYRTQLQNNYQYKTTSPQLEMSNNINMMIYEKSKFTWVSKSQLMLFMIILDIPTTKWLRKMCYIAQTQDCDTSVSHFGQFLKSKPCLLPALSSLTLLI